MKPLCPRDPNAELRATAVLVCALDERDFLLDATERRFGRDFPAVVRLGCTWVSIPFWTALGGINSDGRDWGVDVTKARRWKQMRNPLLGITTTATLSLVTAAIVLLGVLLETFLERRYYVAEICSNHEMIHPMRSWNLAMKFGGITGGFGVISIASGVCLRRSETFAYKAFPEARETGLRGLIEADVNKLQRQGLLGFEASRRLRVAQAIERDLRARETGSLWVNRLETLKGKHLPHDPDGFAAAYDNAWDRKKAYFTRRRAELDNWYAEGAYLDYFSERAFTTTVMSFDAFKQSLR